MTFQKSIALNPLLPIVPYMTCLAKTLISILKGIIKKIIWASRLWVGRRKEPILGYVPRNDDKRNSGSKRLKGLVFCCWMIKIGLQKIMQVQQQASNNSKKILIRD